MGDVRDRMKKLTPAWKSVEAASGRGTGLPDGKCQLMIQEPASGVMLTEDSDNAIRARVKVVVVSCSDESFVGKGGSKSWTLINGDGSPNEKGLSYLKKDLQTMGVENAGNLSGEKIGEALVQCVGVVLDSNISHYKDDNGNARENIYFNAKAGDSGKKPAKKNGKKGY